MSTADWLTMFPQNALNNLTSPMSDHSPILLRTEVMVQMQFKRRFKFENKWLSEVELPQIIEQCWKTDNFDILEKLAATSEALTSWAIKITKEQKKEKVSCERMIESLQLNTDIHSVEKLMDEKKKLPNILLKEEIFWKQRAKITWLREGDYNTRFFHSMASLRKKKNSIKKA